MQRGACAVFALVIVLGSGLLGAQLPAQTPSQTPAQQYNQLRDLTRMDRPGAQPFHFRMDVQLYDIHGKPSQTGVIEEWWASPGEYRLQIDSGSIHELLATGQPEQLAPLTRASYLLNELFQAAVHPLAPFYANTTVAESKQRFENASFRCFALHESFDVEAGPPTYCVDAGTENLRLVAHDFEIVLRNSVGTFHGSHVALSNTISYFGRDAITGTMTVLERLQPAAPGVPALQPSPTLTPAVAGSTPQLSRKGTGGHVRKKTPPVYPASARAAHIEGTVLLHAIITTEGRLRSLVVLASPDDALSQAALDAVSTWRCDPYRLNGKPTEVSTTIPVDFKLNP